MLVFVIAIVLREMKMNFVASLLYPGINQNNVHDLLLKKMYVDSYLPTLSSSSHIAATQIKSCTDHYWAVRDCYF